MNELLSLAIALITGVFIGGIYFGALWWTVKKGSLSKQPGLWFLGSLLFRTSLALAGFYLIARDHWENLFVCLLGFVIARLIVTRFTRVVGKPTDLALEANHAPYSR
jgi:F1F0 ATPase subunit 2